MDRKILAAIIVLASIAAVEGVYIALTMQGLTGRFPGSIDVIYEEYSQQLNANIELIDDLNELKMEHTALTNEHDRLQQTYEDFMTEKNETDASYAVILGDFTALESEYEETSEELLELQADYDSLWVNYGGNQAAYDSLAADMSNLEEEYQEHRDNYLAIVGEVNARAGLGALKGRMITPEDAAVLSATLDVTITLGDGKSDLVKWNDFRTLYNWVEANIDYTYDSPHPVLSEDASVSPQWESETYRYPNETLAEGRGDDEDQAVLLASMLQAYDGDAVYWVIRASSDTSMRSAALMVGGGRTTLLDPESDYYTGKEIGSLLKHPAEYTVPNWFDDWGEANMRIISVFNMDICVEFASTQEFYDWVNGL
jgi:hypothetical protein